MTAEKSKSERIRVLLVEDNPTDADLVRTMLDVPELRLEFVSTLSAARATLARGGVAVVLLDLNLPDAKDLTAVSTLVPEFPEVPLIVLTGLNDEAVGLAAVRAGAHDYIVKGEMSVKLLHRAIQYAVERKKRPRGTETP